MSEFTFTCIFVSILFFCLGHLCGGYIKSRGFTRGEVATVVTLTFVMVGCVRLWHGSPILLPAPEVINTEVEPEVTSAPGAYNKACVAIFDKDGGDAAVQFADAVNTNIRPDLYDILAPIVCAIRHAENGGHDREYGILDPRVDPTYRSQAGWCAATVQKNWDRYITAGGDTSDLKAFIKFLGDKYCPIGAENDPTGLNRYWDNNVNYFLEFLFTV